MLSVKEIKELRKYLVDTYHSKRIRQQEVDNQYYDDTFKVPFLKEGDQWIVRTGKGARMVDGPAEHIITSNPQVFREPTKKTDTDSAARIAAELNRWAKAFLRQNPQPYKQHCKDELLRGEAWIYIIHNEDFNPNDYSVLDTPVIPIIPDPMVVFPDPEGGEVNGIPGRVIISYERIASNIKRNYPYWTWKNQKNRKWSDKVPFFMYLDSDMRYFEADDEALLTDGKGNLSNGEGVQKNIYEITPLVHAYSGFGRASADGDPASLAVGRLRWVRDLLAEQCAIRSALNAMIHKFAHKSLDLVYEAGGPEPSGDIGEKYSREANAFNLVGLPPGAQLVPAVDQLPDQQVFQHLYNIETQIIQEDPLGMIGGQIGSSGRQQIEARESGLRRYDTVVENTSHAFATAFGIGMMICDKLNYISPFKKTDLKGNYECSIELKVDDPIEKDRLATLGSRLYQEGQIDLKTNLIRYQGFNDDEAEDIMANILVDNATRNNPIIAEIMGRQLAREAGMEQQYEALKAEAQLAENTTGRVPQQGARGGQPREGNVITQTGREQADMSLSQRGQRRAPVG